MLEHPYQSYFDFFLVLCTITAIIHYFLSWTTSVSIKVRLAVKSVASLAFVGAGLVAMFSLTHKRVALSIKQNGKDVVGGNSDDGWWRLLLGLAVGAVGDIFLVFDKQKLYFVLGLTCFLMGHICYMYAFTTYTTFSFDKMWSGIPTTAILIVTNWCYFVPPVYRHAKVLIVPIVCYITIIHCMCLCAYSTGQVDFVVASLFFFAADWGLAHETFVVRGQHKLAASGVIAYYLAQLFFAYRVAGSSLLEYGPIDTALKFGWNATEAVLSDIVLNARA